MKLNYLSILLLFAGFSVDAQMYVSGGSYMYVNDEVVFVKQDVELPAANSNIYLRNRSQLVQGTAGASTNKGLGSLSVFQEGTSDAYDYNYWCSPVGGSLAAAGNSPFGVTQLGRPTSVTATTPATMLAMSSYNGTSNPLAIAPYWVWKFLSSTTYSQWMQAGTASTINAGEGFTMKGTGGVDAAFTDAGATNNPGSAQRYDFRGKPNDGNITINVAANAFTLTGNPYPSALDVSRFLLEPGNSNLTRIAYYWDQQRGLSSHYITSYTGAYATYAPVVIGSTGVYVPATYVKYDGYGNIIPGAMGAGANVIRLMAPVGQGFMVRGALTGPATIMNTHRAWYKEGGANTIFAKGAQPKEMSLKEAQSPDYNYAELDLTPIRQIRLGVILEGVYQRTLALALLDQATDGIDPGMDALSPAAADLPSDAYFFLNNDKYVIQAIAFDVNKRLPLGIKVTNTKKFMFHVDDVINFDNNQSIYVFDRLTGLYNDVKGGTYELVLEPGTYNDRFELTFTDGLLSNDEVADVEKLFNIFQNNTSSNLTIKNPNAVELQSCTLFDITGKTVLSKTNLGSNTNYEFATSGLSEGVYIVKLITASNQEMVKKVSIQNKK